MNEFRGRIFDEMITSLSEFDAISELFKNENVLECVSTHYGVRARLPIGGQNLQNKIK